MEELVTAFGLFLVFEGLLYAVAPAALKSMAKQLPDIADQTLRTLGVVVIGLGVFIVWMVRG